MKRKCLLILSVVLSIGSAYCIPHSTTNGTGISVNTVKDSVRFSEAVAYKMLYENQIASNGSILNTIFYALGGLAAAILFVFASNWWFNDKKVKELIREIDTKVQRIKDETYLELSEKISSTSVEKVEELNSFQNKIQTDINIAISNITGQFNSFSDSLLKQIKEDNKDLLSNYQKQLDSFNANYTQQISTLNENLKSSVISIKENINDKEAYLKKLLNSEEKSRLNEINNLKRRIVRNEAWMWEGRNIPNNTLRTLLEELDLKISSDSDLKFVLGQILETSQKLTWLLLSNKTEIREKLTKLPEKYSSIIEEILAITDNVKEL